MNIVETILCYSIENFLSDREINHILESIEAYKRSVDPQKLAAGGTGYTIHRSGGLSVTEAVAVYEPAGRIDVNWQQLPRDIVEIVEAAFYRRIEDVRRAYPRAYGPYGFTYVEYQPGQFFTAHIDGASQQQVAGFGVTLTDDFDGGEFSVETCGSGRMWMVNRDGELSTTPGHDVRSEWYRTLPRTRWMTRPKRGNALFYGSGLTHSSQPVTKGVLKKVLAFIHSF